MTLAAMADNPDRRRSLLAAAVGFLQLEPRAPELRLLHRWLDCWRGIGDIVVGMHRQGWDLQLTAKASRPQSRRCLISVIASLRSDQPAAWGGKRFHE
jgi:hypothetical protein